MTLSSENQSSFLMQIICRFKDLFLDASILLALNIMLIGEENNDVTKLRIKIPKEKLIYCKHCKDSYSYVHSTECPECFIEPE